MNEIERQLWARVYAAEYDRLAQRAAACFEPSTMDSYRPGRKQEWRTGSTSRELEESAKQVADRAVAKLRLAAGTAG